MSGLLLLLVAVWILRRIIVEVSDSDAEHELDEWLASLRDA